ncbi:DNA translocase FtsK [Paenalkalicoccus suaedae]|uniref:DNA translocase FtsK n=1 Tax=Paenalkalicoccus suaedae TaxID=2592382 RepID=A0A859FDU9_9BACI|nr:DNA translocase FtsK [Paenalkalicoccus suaedae]QKS71379.1 DNA translocase FtsK [Paenalkalicoccus suaedae]
MAKKTKKKRSTWKHHLKFELLGLFLLLVSLLTFAQLGFVGESVVWFFRFFLGSWHILLTGAVFLLALYIMIKRKYPTIWGRRYFSIYIFVFALTLISHVQLFRSLETTLTLGDQSVIRQTFSLYFSQLQGTTQITELGGGMIGAVGFAVTYFLFSSVGTIIFAIGLMIAAVMIFSGISFTDVVKKGGALPLPMLRKLGESSKERFMTWKESRSQSKQEKASQAKKPITDDDVDDTDFTPTEEEPIIYDFTSQVDKMESKDEPKKLPPAEEIIDVEEEETDGKVTITKEADSEATKATGSLVIQEAENASYTLPPMTLLMNPKKSSQAKEHSLLSKNARKLEKTLESFGVSAKVTKVHLGPSVTKYEVYPSTGVKVSRIVNLSDDLALALAAKDIRMEAPIPGKSAIGIEVPNQEVSLVTLREVLDAPTMKQSTNPLSTALGRDISGDAVMADLNKMPHLLVAGATGSGKSVCINGIIVSILLRSKPHEVKLMMIDPKMVELNVYNGIPHLLSPVVTEPKKAAQALKKVVNEMERRYELFASTGTRNIEGYNSYIKRENESRAEDEQYKPLPYIVVIVDELADLMMVASSEVEDAITRLAQMARAAGIHLIIATQRPSVDVITGVIKANIPSRIAFGVSSSTDSRTILDGSGAEKLLGKGDMLFLPVGASKPTRIQGAFLSDSEVEKVVRHCIEQQKAQYATEMMPSDKPEQELSEVSDELYDDAVTLVTEMQTASVSMLQRRFRVGYARAARLIDEMEQRGVVGPYEGSKPREVLVAKEQEEV